MKRSNRHKRSFRQLNTTFVRVASFCYRGYIYDTETGFYYLQSRYYDPEVGRFINANGTEYLGANGDMQAFNLLVFNWGFSASLSFVFADDDFGIQYTFYYADVNEESNDEVIYHNDVWGIDIGPTVSLQMTEKNSLKELEGISHYYGGDILGGGDIIYDENYEYIGWQYGYGTISYNSHRITTHTGTLFSIPTLNLPKRLKEAGWIK